MRLFSGTIASRLFQLLVLALGIVIFAVAAMWRLSVEPALRRGVAATQREVARRAAEQIDEFIASRIAELEAAVELGRFWEERRDRQRQALYRLLKIAPHIEEVSLVDGFGQEVLRFARGRVYTDANLRSLERSPSFRVAVQGGVYIGPVYHLQTAEPYVTIGIPVRFTAREIGGVLVAEVNLKRL